MNRLFKSIQIQTIDKCNLKCWFCPNSYLKMTGRLMPEKLYHKIINELSELEYKGRVSPYLMNESLLDKRLAGLVAYTRKKLPEALIMISTNGTLLTSERLKELRDAGMDKFFISCYSKEVYEKARQLGLKSMIKFYEKDPNKVFYNRGGNMDIEKKRKPPLKLGCKKPFAQMYITYTGEAVLCCSDYKKEVVMGNVNKEKLIDIWNGEKYEHYRKYLTRKERSKLELCDRCNYGA